MGMSRMLPVFDAVFPIGYAPTPVEEGHAQKKGISLNIEEIGK
jgi:hypothetical protein